MREKGFFYSERLQTVAASLSKSNHFSSPTVDWIWLYQLKKRKDPAQSIFISEDVSQTYICHYMSYFRSLNVTNGNKEYHNN